MTGIAVHVDQNQIDSVSKHCKRPNYTALQLKP